MLPYKLILWRWHSGCRMLPHNRSCSYYALLGVRPDATHSDIKAAYLEKCHVHHPDKNTGDMKKESHSKFQEIQHAYSVLSKPDSREMYDMVLTGRPNTVREVHLDDEGYATWDQTEVINFKKTSVYRIVRNISVFLFLLWISMKSMYKIKLYRMEQRCRLRDETFQPPVNIRYKKSS